MNDYRAILGEDYTEPEMEELEERYLAIFNRWFADIIEDEGEISYSEIVNSNHPGYSPEEILTTLETAIEDSKTPLVETEKGAFRLKD